MPKKPKGYKQLSKKDQDMVYVLAMGLCAARGSKDKLAYTEDDIVKQYGIQRRSLGALKANIVRQG